MTTDSQKTWLDRTVGVWRWRVHPDWAWLLNGADHPNCLALEKDPRARLVKSNNNRQVWRVEASSGLVYVKLAAPGSRWAKLGRRLFGTDAAREKRIAEYAAANGINAVVPVALAETRAVGKASSSILVTAGLDHAIPLSDFWRALDADAPDTRQVKNRVIDEVARLIAHAHQHGFEHKDLHAGNILIERCDDGAYRAVFVDLLNVRIDRPIHEDTVVGNLAKFNQWFRLRGTLTDRIRFFDRYLHWREATSDATHAQSLARDRRALLHAVGEVALAHAETLGVKRDRRIRRTGRYFSRIRLPAGWRGHVFLQSKRPVPGSPASSLIFTQQQWERWLAQPLKWVQTTDRRKILKDSASVIVCRENLPINEKTSLPIVCKRSMPGGLKRLTSAFRTSRSMLTWERANALLHRQIPTARPLAVVEKRRCGFLLDSLLVTEYLENAHDLDTLVTIHLRDLLVPRQRALKDHIIGQIVSILCRLAEGGRIHRDMKAPNVMVQWDPDSTDPPRVLLVDLDGVLKPWRTRPDGGVRAIMRLNVSLDHCRLVTRSDRLRFLKRYLERTGQPTADWKTLWHRIAQWSQTKRTLKAHTQQRKLQRMAHV